MFSLQLCWIGLVLDALLFFTPHSFPPPSPISAYLLPGPPCRWRKLWIFFILISHPTFLQCSAPISVFIVVVVLVVNSCHLFHPFRLFSFLGYFWSLSAHETIYGGIQPIHNGFLLKTQHAYTVRAWGLVTSTLHMTPAPFILCPQQRTWTLSSQTPTSNYGERKALGRKAS